MNRRKLLAQMCGAALYCTTQNPVSAMSPTAAGGGDVTGHLDLRAAEIVKIKFLAEEAAQAHYGPHIVDLDVSRYTSADIDALDCLTALCGGSAVLGFDSISPEMAQVLGHWETYCLIFEKLETLLPESAVHLGRADAGHSLFLEPPIKLDVATVTALAANGSQLQLNFNSCPDLPCARALSKHEHEMFLEFPVTVTSSALGRALSRHSGHLLKIKMPKLPPTAVLQALAANPAKKISVKYRNFTQEQVEISIADTGFNGEL